MELTHELPRDIDELTTLVLRQREELAALSQAKQQLEAKYSRLEHNSEILYKIVFGRSTEKRSATLTGEGNPQFWLFAQEIVEEAARLASEYGVDVEVKAAKPKTTAPAKRKKKGRRREFPEHLPVIRTTVKLPEDQRHCHCGAELKVFSHQVSRELERIEITIVHETWQEKGSCPSCQDAVVTAPWRGRVIEKGLLGPGFLAHLITERFNNHLPYYRLEKKYHSEGLNLSRSVLCSSVARCAELLEPIAEELKRRILESPVIHTDDTPVTLARSGEGGSRKGRIWVYLNPEGLHWYDFTETREAEGPAKVLENYHGYIQADAYKGYDQIYEGTGATEVACWAHVRRKFLDAEKTEPEHSRAAVDRIARLFRIEREADEQHLPPEARRRLREAKAKPLLEEFDAWMNATQLEVLPKGPMGRAITYAKNQWSALETYLEDGRLSISNNAAERGLRPVAVGRKNWLFFQRAGGGKTAAILMSLLVTAKAAGVNPRDYFRDVLLRISTCSDVASLTPHGWKERWEPTIRSHQSEILEKLTLSQS